MVARGLEGSHGRRGAVVGGTALPSCSRVPMWGSQWRWRVGSSEGSARGRIGSRLEVAGPNVWHRRGQKSGAGVGWGATSCEGAHGE